MFKQAYRFDDQTVFYFDEYDNKYVAKGGSLAWRLNNPGLLHAHEPFVHKFNRIGAHAPFVIFPTASVGTYVLQEWLKAKFSNTSIFSIAKYYQPESPEECLQKLCQLANIPIDTTLKALSKTEFQCLIKAIQLFCEFSSAHEGILSILPKISRRYHSAKGKVEYYLVGYETLLSKSEAISWVDEHRLDAVIVHRKNGTIYLRLRPGHHLNQIHLTNEDYGEETEFENAIRDIGNKKNGQCIWGYINGVWNTDTGATATTKLISNLTGNEQVWSLVNNTKGKIKDLIECGRQKVHLNSAIVKFAAKFFQLLLHLAEEDSTKAPVIVFVHSQGAIIADLALELLSLNECRNLRIFTFGGGSFIPPEKAHEDTYNYTSEADLIPRIGSYKAAKLLLRYYEKQKQGLTEKEIIEHLINEDADYELETTDPKAIEIFRKQRKSYYEKEFAKLVNVTVLDRSQDATWGHWEHTFEVPCYQRVLKDLIKRFQNVAH